MVENVEISPRIVVDWYNFWGRGILAGYNILQAKTLILKLENLSKLISILSINAHLNNEALTKERP